MEPAQRGEQRSRLGLGGGGAADDGRAQEAVAGVGEVRHGLGREPGIRTDLGEGRHPALVRQPPHGVPEAHGFPGVPYPVPGAEQLIGGRRSAGQAREHRYARRVVGQLARDTAEFGEHGLHQRGMEGVADPKSGGAAPARGELLREREDGLFRAGDDDRARAVHGRDLHPVGEPACHLCLGGVQRHHCAAPGQLPHQPSTGGDQVHGVLLGQDARGVSRGQFADGVPGQEVRPHAPGLQQPEHGHFEDEQRGLGEVRTIQQAALVGFPEHRAQRAVQMGVEALAQGVEGAGEDRKGDVQLAAHTRVLGALAGEQQGESADGARVRLG